MAKRLILSVCITLIILSAVLISVQAGDDKGSVIILGMPGGGFGGNGGYPNIVSGGDKKGDTIIIGPNW